MRLKTGEPLLLKRPPLGWRNLALQLLILCGAWLAYRYVRGLIHGETATATAMANGRAIADLEQSMGLMIEPAASDWTHEHPAIGNAAAIFYVNFHFLGTFTALVFLYLRRTSCFFFVRNMFVLAMTMGLVGYVLFPTAPPRLLPELALHDPVQQLTGVNVDGQGGGSFFNPYAAVPSMHVAFALMLGWSMARAARTRGAQLLWGLYPLLMTTVVVITANHWWIDAVLGAAVAVVAAAGAAALSRWRPNAWSFRVARPVPALAAPARR